MALMLIDHSADVAFCRARAEELRQKAALVNAPELSEQAFRIAALYERLADKLEAEDRARRREAAASGDCFGTARRRQVSRVV
jgi:hypothetical protein